MMEPVDHGGSGGHAEFREGTAQMGAYGPVRDVELVGDEFVRKAGGDEASDFEFAGAEGFFDRGSRTGVEDKLVSTLGLAPGSDSLRLHDREC